MTQKTITITIEKEDVANLVSTAIYEAVRALGIGATIDFGTYKKTTLPTTMSQPVVSISEPKSKPHPHAALMAEYAKDAAETDRPWERWQCRTHGHLEWTKLDKAVVKYQHPTWRTDFEYRRSPKTIRIGEFEVPEPMRITPKMGSRYYSAVCTDATYTWENDLVDQAILAAGLLHDNQEAAITHHNAMKATYGTGA